MAVWTVVPDSAQLPDQPIKSSEQIAIKNNITALAEGASGAPRIQNAAMDSSSVDNANVVNGSLGAEKFQSGTTERDWARARVGGIPYTSGTLLTLYERPGEQFTAATSPYDKLGEIFSSLGSGTIRYSFDLRTDVAGRGVDGVILRDGVVVASHNNTSTTYVTYTGTISVSFGSSVEFRYGDDGGLSSNAYTRNVLISASY